MARLYAFLLHFNQDCKLGWSYCESAVTEKPTGEEAKKTLESWIEQRQKICGKLHCDHTSIITEKIRLKMILSGMTMNMIMIE